jgi:ribonuclease VapC
LIAVDTSALMAILLDEPKAEDCMAAIQVADRLLIAAATVAEALIVAGRRDLAEEMDALVTRLGFEVVSLDGASAHRIAVVYGRWGKGLHPAALNFGDCFAYEIADRHDCPLLFVGDDFSQTDVRSAL